MRRKRFQKGSVRPRKHGRTRVWVGQWWELGQKKSKVLGRCTDIAKSEAEAKLAIILKPFNEGVGLQQKPIYTFGVYLQEIFLPAVRRKWKESTRVTTEPRMVFHLIPALGKRLLQQITREEMQALLDEKALGWSRSVVDHLRWDLNAIFKMAVSDGHVPYNPASGLFTPPCKVSAEKLVLSSSQVRDALGVLDLRERLIFRLGVFEGMRPGEILALQLGHVEADSISIEQRVYKGKMDSPKGRKGRPNTRRVGLSPGTAMELATWKKSLLKTGPESFLFPTERDTPFRRENIWSRHLEPRLATIGLEWATFQVLRRTNASLSRKAEIDDKVAADQRGHGLGVSLGVYSISDLQQKIEAAKCLETEVFRK